MVRSRASAKMRTRRCRGQRRISLAARNWSRTCAGGLDYLTGEPPGWMALAIRAVWAASIRSEIAAGDSSTENSERSVMCTVVTRDSISMNRMCSLLIRISPPLLIRCSCSRGISARRVPAFGRLSSCICRTGRTRTRARNVAWISDKTSPAALKSDGRIPRPEGSPKARLSSVALQYSKFFAGCEETHGAGARRHKDRNIEDRKMEVGIF